MTNPWDKIFIDDFETAYKIADKNFLQTSESFDLRARAICSFLLRKYDNALADFLSLIEIEKQTNRISDGTYIEVALCYYAVGENDKAIDFFKYSVINRKEIKYTSDVSVAPSILLFIASKFGRQDLIKIANKELKQLSKNNIPIINYLLGLSSQDEVDKVYKQHHNETIRIRKECKVEFYKAVFALINKNFNQYKEHLSRCVDIKGKYLEIEYYIAKVELEILSGR